MTAAAHRESAAINYALMALKVGQTSWLSRSVKRAPARPPWLSGSQGRRVSQSVRGPRGWRVVMLTDSQWVGQEAALPAPSDASQQRVVGRDQTQPP
jgi:hypothetical protein